MGLRCSLLGHAYGEPVTERERERRGDEEVVTVTKLRTCTRCGAETVLSENTEVRHLDSVRETLEQQPTAPEEGGGDGPSSGPEPAADTAESPTGDSTETTVSDLIETAEGSNSATSDSRPDESSPTGAQAGESTAEPIETNTGDRSTETGAGDGPTGTNAGETHSSAEKIGTAAADGERGTPATEPSGTGSSSAESEPESGDAADDGIIIEDSDGSVDEQAEEESVDPNAVDSSAEAGTGQDDFGKVGENPSTGMDSVDDVDEAPTDSRESPTRRPESQAPEEPRDTTDSTVEPESMFGTGEAEETGETASSGSEPAAERDHWKERSPADASNAQARGEPADRSSEGRADPAFQFESPGDTEGETAESSSTRRGPSGIASEGPLEVDEEGERSYESLVCPECGFSESAVSSLRAGDICPDCHRGYLAGRR
ncbi:MAG: hypothetical protein ABEJ84_06955 [Halodesulfurarchaeum sp.]